MIICSICKLKFKTLTYTHYKYHHNLKYNEIKQKFPDLSFRPPVLCNKLSPKDSRYKKWRKSLYKRPSVWNKGLTKYKHPGLQAIAQARLVKNNLESWHAKINKLNVTRNKYHEFKKDKKLAEFIGLVLGDGNIFCHERTERLTVAFNNKYPRIINRGEYLFRLIFNKKPVIYKKESYTKIWIYEKYISRRLEIPPGNKKKHDLHIPIWISDSYDLSIACLVGLFNAEGSYSIHKPSGTYNLQFANINQTLLKDVYDLLSMLKFNPILRKRRVWLRRKNEAEEFVKIIKFRYFREN